MSDVMVLALISVGMGLTLLGVISFVLSWFVALRSTPSNRALWTAGIAYVLATFLLLLNGSPAPQWAVPLVVLPSGLIAFWYWRSAFLRAWTNDSSSLPDGTSLEEDDWRAGLFRFLALAAVVVGAGLIRWFVRGV